MHHYLTHVRSYFKPERDELIVGSTGNILNGLIAELQGINSGITNALHILASVILNWLKKYSKREVQYKAGHKHISSVEKYAMQELGWLEDQLSKHHPLDKVKKGVNLSQITTIMKGVNYITDVHNKKVAVQIDLKLLEKYDQEIEDLIDGIIAESRKDEAKKPLHEVIKGLKQKGKLKGKDTLWSYPKRLKKSYRDFPPV